MGVLSPANVDRLICEPIAHSYFLCRCKESSKETAYARPRGRKFSLVFGENFRRSVRAVLINTAPYTVKSSTHVPCTDVDKLIECRSRIPL